MKLLLLFLLAVPLSASGYIQNESIVLGEISGTTYKFIIAENQSYYEFLYLSGAPIDNLTDREKNYYVSALVNVFYIKNGFTPLYE